MYIPAARITKAILGMSDNDASPDRPKHCIINWYDIAFCLCQLINCEGHPTAILKKVF